MDRISNKAAPSDRSATVVTGRVRSKVAKYEKKALSSFFWESTDIARMRARAKSLARLEQWVYASQLSYRQRICLGMSGAVTRSSRRERRKQAEAGVLHACGSRSGLAGLHRIGSGARCLPSTITMTQSNLLFLHLHRVLNLDVVWRSVKSRRKRP